MARRLRSVDLDFVPVAPLRLVFAAEVSAPPEAVYRALAEDVEGWPSWFAAVTADRPTEAGAGREVRLKGGTMFRETVLAKGPGERYAYRVDETNAPALQALLEEWRLSPAATGAGTRVQWTFAADGGCRSGSPCGWAGPGWAGRSGTRCAISTSGSPPPPPEGSDRG